MKKIVIALTAALMFVSCGCDCLVDNSSETTPKPQRDTATTIMSYKIKGYEDALYIDKMTIDGHEYLLFSSKLANSPTVVHNMACPCNKTDGI